MVMSTYHPHALGLFLTHYSNLPLKYALWIGDVGVHLVGRCVLYSYHFLDPLIRWIAIGNRWNLRQPTWLNLKVLLTSKALKLYTILSSTSTTNCLASMFKRKLNKCMINCDDLLRRFSETLTNWHWMSSIIKSCIHDKWLCMTCSNNKVWTLIFVKKNCTLNEDMYLNGCILKRETIVNRLQPR